MIDDETLEMIRPKKTVTAKQEVANKIAESDQTFATVDDISTIEEENKIRISFPHNHKKKMYIDHNIINLTKYDVRKSIDGNLAKLIPILLKESNCLNKYNILNQFSESQLCDVVISALGIGEFFVFEEMNDYSHELCPQYYYSRIIENDGYYWGGCTFNLCAYPVLSSKQICNTPNSSNEDTVRFSKWKINVQIYDTLRYIQDEEINKKLTEQEVCYDKKDVCDIEITLTVNSDNVEYKVINGPCISDCGIEAIGKLMSRLENKIKYKNCLKCLKCGETPYCQSVDMNEIPNETDVNISVSNNKLRIPKIVATFVKNNLTILSDIDILISHVLSRTHCQPEQSHNSEHNDN